MDLLIPASGYATRMNKIPKFLLPVTLDGKGLLEVHLESAKEFYERILIGTRPELIPLLNEQKLGENVRIVPLETTTMAETILALIGESRAPSFSLVMPDTFFAGESPHEFLSTSAGDLNLALWKVRESQRGKLGQIETDGASLISAVDKDPECELPYAWGALSFSHKFASLLNPEMPHVGYGIPLAIQNKLENKVKLIKGQYFDCGTPSEYFELIKFIK